MKINKSVDATNDLIELLCEEEINKKDSDVVYVIAVTALLGISGVALWLVWDLVLLVLGE
jgi:hypothetical protein|tara:strand:- start:10275 stop:10454 length:180 start_codon:yes stop_codon:yes gene_type:complete